MENSIMDILPDELLMKIFEYISPVELSLVTKSVCAKWKNLITSRIVRINRSEDFKKLHMGVEVILVLHANRSVTSAGVIIGKALEFSPRIRELIITSEFLLSPSDFKRIQKLVYLRHLDVFVKMWKLDKEVVVNKNLTSFVVHHEVESGFFTNLSPNKITSLHMYGRYSNFPIRIMEPLFKFQSVNLRELTLRCTSFKDVDYKVLTQCCNLVSLQLYSCWLLTSRGVEHIAALPPLRRLHITGTALLRDKALSDMIEKLPTSVVALNLSATCFNLPHAQGLSRRLPDLRALELWRVPLETNHLLELASRLLRLENLDTDVILDRSQIRTLEELPSFVKLRCQYEGTIDTSLTLTSAGAVVPGLLQQTGDGPSAELTYHWQQPLAPQYIPRRHSNSGFSFPINYSDYENTSDSDIEFSLNLP